MRRVRWTGGFAALVVCLVLAMTNSASVSMGSHTQGEKTAKGQSAERVIKWISFQNAPLELTDMRVAGKSIKDKATVVTTRRSAQWKELKVDGNDTWLKDLSFTFKNVSGRRIAALTVTCVVQHPELELPLSLPLRASKRVPQFLVQTMPKLEGLGPNEELTYSFHQSELSKIDQLLNRAGALIEIRNIEVNQQWIQFDYDTVWSDGIFFHPDPNNPSSWLPEKRGANSRTQSPFTQVTYRIKNGGLEAMPQGMGEKGQRDIYPVAFANTMMHSTQSGCYASSNSQVFQCNYNYDCVFCSDVDSYVNTNEFGSFYEQNQWTYCRCWDGGSCIPGIPSIQTVRIHNPNCVI